MMKVIHDLKNPILAIEVLIDNDENSNNDIQYDNSIKEKNRRRMSN